jgi:hypothetical protein
MFLQSDNLGKPLILPKYVYHFIYPEALDDYWYRLYRECYVPTIDVSRGFHCVTIHKRIWLISGSWARDNTLDENSIYVREYVNRKYNRLFEQWIGGILVGLYEKKVN